MATSWASLNGRRDVEPVGLKRWQKVLLLVSAASAIGLLILAVNWPEGEVVRNPITNEPEQVINEDGEFEVLRGDEPDDNPWLIAVALLALVFVGSGTAAIAKPALSLLRGEELAARRTSAIIIIATLVLFGALVVTADVTAGVQQFVLLAALVLALLPRGGRRSPVAEWWYREPRYPRITLAAWGTISALLGAAQVAGRDARTPFALVTTWFLLSLARWIAYQRRQNRPAKRPTLADTPERSYAKGLYMSDPARFMRHQAKGAGHGVYLGALADRWKFSEAEHAVLVLGPPRSGKTSAVVIPTILCWNGPLLSTSVKTDVMRATIGTRRKGGECWLFDPTGTVAVPEGAELLKWSPLTGCEDWERARLIARAMVGAAQNDSGTRMNESHWIERAEALLGPALHAAALGGFDMEAFVEWINLRDLDPALFVLNGLAPLSAPRRSLEGLKQLDQTDHERLWLEVRGALRGRYDTGELKEATSWGDALRVAHEITGRTVSEPWTDESSDAEPVETLIALVAHAASREGANSEAVSGWVEAGSLEGLGQRYMGLGSRQAGSSLSGIEVTDSRELSSIWSTASGVIAAYQSEAALATTRGAAFDASSFVHSGQSIYVAATSEKQRLVAPLVAGLIEEIRRATYAAADAGTLVRPVLLALDEVKNIAPLKELPSLVSEAGGQKLVVMVCLQDLSQAQQRWGDEAKGFLSLFNTNVILRGIKERDTLDLVSVLFGEHEVEVQSRSVQDFSFAQAFPQSGGRAAPSTTTSTRKERRVPLDEVARGVPGQAIILAGAEAPEWVHLTPYFGADPFHSIVSGSSPRALSNQWHIHDAMNWEDAVDTVDVRETALELPDQADSQSLPRQVT